MPCKPINIELRGLQILFYCLPAPNVSNPLLYFHQVMIARHSSVNLNCRPSDNPWINQQISQTKLLSHCIRHDKLIIQLLKILCRLTQKSFLFFFRFSSPSLEGIKVGNNFLEVSRKLTDPKSFHRICWNQLSARIIFFSHIPSDKIAFCQDSLSSDQDGNFAIRFGISGKTLLIESSKLLRFVFEIDQFELIIGSFLFKG